jgi:hypothetical protein
MWEQILNDIGTVFITCVLLAFAFIGSKKK